MKKQNLLFLFVLFLCGISFAQKPATVWKKSLGGISDDYAESIQQTVDGGYIIAGNTGSNDGDVTGNHGYLDYWIVKLDATGITVWQKSLGGSINDYASSIQQTADGGYIVAGGSYSNDGDVTGNHGDSDYWIVKLDAAGNIVWQKCLGGTRCDYAGSIQQTADGGYIVAGSSGSNNGDITGNHGGSDYWIVKLDAAGNIVWQKSLGGTEADKAYSIQQTADGGYIIAGSSESNDGDVTGNHGYSDYWIVKLDAAGNIDWQKSLGGTFVDVAFSIQQTADGGYIVAGSSGSNDGDVTGNHGSNFYLDYWIVKLDAVGNIVWQKSLGGTSSDHAQSIQQTADGGYIVAGYSKSNDGDVIGHHGSTFFEDYWIVKLNSSGMIELQKSLGGTRYDNASSIQQTADSGYIIAGSSGSKDGDVTGNHGGSDFWIVKLQIDLGIRENALNIAHISIYPNPATKHISIDLKEYKNKDTEVSIFDIDGREINKLKATNHHIIVDICDLPCGLYFVKVVYDNAVEVGKFVKQ